MDTSQGAAAPGEYLVSAMEPKVIWQGSTDSTRSDTAVSSPDQTVIVYSGGKNFHGPSDHGLQRSFFRQSEVMQFSV